MCHFQYEAFRNSGCLVHTLSASGPGESWTTRWEEPRALTATL